MGKLAGSKAVVTGAGSGIGEAVGRALVARGASVVLADIDSEAVVRLAAN
jgi:NAD(P)-dependent dehydrogenase (short-subunit alcohol dehydrogenase family)